MLFEKVLEDSGIMEMLKKDHAEELVNIYKEFYEPLEKISVKKEKSAEVTKEPKITDSVEVGGKTAKPVSKGGKGGKGEKITYFKPAKPGKVSPFGKYKANGGAGVAKIKPTEIKTPKVNAKPMNKEKQNDNINKDKILIDMGKGKLKQEFENRFGDSVENLKVEFGSNPLQEQKDRQF